MSRCGLGVKHSQQSCSPTGLVSQPSCFHFEQEIERRSPSPLYWQKDNTEYLLGRKRRQCQPSSSPRRWGLQQQQTPRHFNNNNTSVRLCLCVCLCVCCFSTVSLDNEALREDKRGVELTPQIKSDSSRSQLHSKGNTTGVHVSIWGCMYAQVIQRKHVCMFIYMHMLP